MDEQEPIVYPWGFMLTIYVHMYGLRSWRLAPGFNEGLKGLPENLQSLTFGTQFNQSLEGLKLPKLQSLTFGNNYRQTLEGMGQRYSSRPRHFELKETT